MKDDILQTSLKYFLKHGVREVSIQKLIEPLGISTKTVYKHFKNKEQLLEEVLHHYHDVQYEKLINLPSEQNTACLFFDIWQMAVDAECKINRSFYEDVRYYYPELEKKVEAAIGKRFEQYFLSIIHRGIKDGSFRKDIVPELALKSVLVIQRAVARTSDFKTFHRSSIELLANTIGCYIRGLCTEKGLFDLDKHIRNLLRIDELEAVAS